MKTSRSGYWTFICNPAEWQIDRFLERHIEEDDYLIASWQASWFSPGQLGVVRVGVDKRTRSQREGRPRLVPGVYAVVEVTNGAKPRSRDDPFWLTDPTERGDRLAVDIRYLRNLLRRPLLLSDLKNDPKVIDRYLVGGFQAASMPLDPGTFDRVVALAGGEESILGNIDPGPADSAEAVAALEGRYADASPRVKEVISRRIERGPVADLVKKLNGYECQVCKAFRVTPIGFLKTDGVPYVEAHHVTPVSRMVPGSLGPSNIITVCANHHRQLHYGDAEVLESTGGEFVFRIDGVEVSVPKVVVPR